MAQRTAGKPTAAKKITRQTRAQRLEQARQFSIEAARLCADLRCRDVRVLDVAGLSPVCDFFVIATAGSARQMKTVVRDVTELSARFDLRPMSGTHRSEPNERWVAIDLVDAIVHLFNEEARLFYDLDNLWGDAQEVSWQRDAAAPTTSAPAEGE
jgi:ribosome-associated protein